MLLIIPDRSRILPLLDKKDATYLVPLVEHRTHPAIILRGTTSHPRTTLKIDQPGQLFIVFNRLRLARQTVDTAGEESQGAVIRLAVVHGDIEEQLPHAQPAWGDVSSSIYNLFGVYLIR